MQGRPVECRAPITMTKPTQILVDTPELYAEAKAYLGTKGEITCDLETDGLDHNRHHTVGIGLLAGDRAYYLPFRHGEGRNLPEPLLRDVCENILPRERPQLGHNYWGFDVKMARKDGLELPDRAQCTIIRAHLLNQDEPSHYKLEGLCEKYIDKGAGDSEKELETLVREAWGGTSKTWKSNMWRMPANQVYLYGTQDLISCRDLRDFQLPHLRTWKLEAYALEVEEYARATTAMELRGILIDEELLATASETASKNADRLEAEIQTLAGEAINPRSSKQLQAWFGLPSCKKQVLELLTDDPRAKAVLEYRGWQRVTSNYYRPLLEQVYQGRHHPSIKVTGTVAGRPSCKGLNWLAIPRGDSEDMTAAMSGVKQLVIPPPGHVLVELDLSQAEIRSLAHYMQQFDPDCMLFDLLRTGESYHDRTARETGLPRSIAKALNLSAQYGIGATKFAEMYGFTLAQATAYLDAYHKAMPGVRRFSRHATSQAREDGYIRICDGRVRRFQPHKDRRLPGRYKDHTAANNLCQGMIAARLRRAKVRAFKEVPEFLQILDVYDCMIGYIAEPGWKDVARRVKAIMEEQIWSDIKFKADCKASDRSWYHAKDVTL